MKKKLKFTFIRDELQNNSGQVSLSPNNHDTGLMKIKNKGQKYPKFSYNIQLETDTKSNLIRGVNILQKPPQTTTKIPALMNQVIHNLNLKPLKLSANTIYSTIANLNYLNDMKITALIPTSQQNKKKILINYHKTHLPKITLSLINIKMFSPAKKKEKLRVSDNYWILKTP